MLMIPLCVSVFSYTLHSFPGYLERKMVKSALRPEQETWVGMSHLAVWPLKNRLKLTQLNRGSDKIKRCPNN